jgi:adenylosuccinate lyase
MNNLLTISPCDGRYKKYTECCQNYFSEYAFQKNRLEIEINYLTCLVMRLPELQILNRITTCRSLYEIVNNFNIKECEKIKEIENVIKHDVKSIEIYIQNKCKELNLNKCISFIHFGLTSQDINNVLYPKIIKDFITLEYKPLLVKTIDILSIMYDEYRGIIMLSHTHGQPGVPTSLGKEMRVFGYRLSELVKYIDNIEYKCKFGGANGNFNAHLVTYPNINWKNFGNNFTKSYGLIRNKYTTQIDNYENLSLVFDAIKRINTVLTDLCQDMWLYIMKKYYKLKINSNEVGSSTMPHKVNPINFENAEGNLGISNALFVHMSLKCPVSRLQRDLTDSTVLRNLGPAFGHSVIAIKNIIIGLEKLEPNYQEIRKDLKNNEVVLAEAYQTIMRKHGVQDAYKKFKDFTRNHSQIQLKDLHEFIASLDINDNIKKEMYKVVIENYTGYL